MRLCEVFTVRAATTRSTTAQQRSRIYRISRPRSYLRIHMGMRRIVSGTCTGISAFSHNVDTGTVQSGLGSVEGEYNGEASFDRENAVCPACFGHPLVCSAS